MDISHFGLFELTGRAPRSSGVRPAGNHGTPIGGAVVANDNGAPHGRRPALRRLLRFAPLRGSPVRPA